MKITSSKITSVSLANKKLTREIKRAKYQVFYNMQLILLENIINLGKIGDKVVVAMATEEPLKQGKA